MEGFKSCTAAVCAVSAGICIVESLVSGTRLRGQMKFILDLVLITVVITPFIKAGTDFQLPEPGGYGTETDYHIEVYSDALRRQVSYNVSEVLLQQIQAAGISCYKIETEVNISDDGSISINNVTLSTDNFTGAADVVRRSLGAETEVVDEAY